MDSHDGHDHEGRASACPSCVLEWAARLHVCGVNVIAVDGKIPRGPWKQWQTRRQGDLRYPLDDEYLIESFGHGGNIAAVTGVVSRIVVADADSRQAWDVLARACGGTLPRTVQAVTAKGRHVWFRHPGGRISNRARVDGVPLDVRGDGGYVVVPPSIHPSGTPYTWHRSPMECWPPAPMPEPLVRLLEPRSVRRPVISRRVITHAAYVETSVERELTAIRTATPGTRNDRLNTGVYSLARFVQRAALSAGELADAALGAALEAGLPEREAVATIDSALKARLG